MRQEGRGSHKAPPPHPTSFVSRTAGQRPTWPESDEQKDTLQGRSPILCRLLGADKELGLH